MVFDLNTTNNLPQSSTSSCTDYFFDGCYTRNKTRNDCLNQYQNSQCRPCCVNSMINDHTYSLLKKICRKVIRDYHRQKSRQKYTIFDGGNSINVRIHRSSFVPGEGICQNLNGDSSFYTIGKTGRKDVSHVRDVKESKYGDRREGTKDGSISDKSGNGSGAKKHVEKEKLRRSQYDTSDSKRDRKKKTREQDYDDNDRGKIGKGQRGKQNDVDQFSVNSKRRKERRRKGVEVGNGDEDNGKGEREKGRRYESVKKGENGNEETSTKKKYKGKMTTDADKDRSSRSIKEMHGSKQKSLDEKVGDPFDAKMGKKKLEKIKQAKGSEDEDPTQVKIKLDRSRNKTLEDNEESGTAKGGKRKQGSSLENKITDIARTEKYDGKKRIPEDNSSEVRHNGDIRYKNSLVGNVRSSPDGDKDVKDPDRQTDKGSRDNRIINKGHMFRDNQNKSVKDIADGNRKLFSQKKKDLTDLPIISDLRRKVRSSHDVMPALKTVTKKVIYHSRSNQDGHIKKKRVKHGQKQYSKGSKDEISGRGARRGKQFRSSRGFRSRFGSYRVHATGMTSRCDEIRPCDILRAHMEQRELCERQRCCYLSCSCECSAVYCQNPSTICSRLC